MTTVARRAIEPLSMHDWIVAIFTPVGYSKTTLMGGWFRACKDADPVRVGLDAYWRDQVSFVRSLFNAIGGPSEPLAMGAPNAVLLTLHGVHHLLLVQTIKRVCTLQVRCCWASGTGARTAFVGLLRSKQGHAYLMRWCWRTRTCSGMTCICALTSAPISTRTWPSCAQTRSDSGSSWRTMSRGSAGSRGSVGISVFEAGC